MAQGSRDCREPCKRQLQSMEDEGSSHGQIIIRERCYRWKSQKCDSRGDSGGGEVGLVPDPGGPCRLMGVLGQLREPR